MSLFKDEQAHPIVLLRKFLAEFGPSSLEWEPAVIKKELEREIKTSVARINVVKLLAAIAVANRDEFWKDWHTFHFLSQALNNNTPSPSTIQAQTVGQMMVAVDTAQKIREDLGPITDTPEFSEEVARYIAAQARREGVWFLPEPLGFASSYASGERQRCHSCGNVEDRQEDSLCSFCTSRYATENLRSFIPDSKLVAMGEGKNIELFEEFDTKKVRTLLAKATSGTHNFSETRDDVCVARIMVALRYLDLRRQQLRLQERAAA